MEGALMSVSDRLLLRKRAIIETVNDELKNIAQVEHSGRDLWKMVRTIILFLFRIIFAWRRETIEDDKVPLSPGWASNSGPTGEIFAYLTHLDIISPGVQYRLKAMLSRMFCVCVLARPRYRQRTPSNHHQTTDGCCQRCVLWHCE